MSLNSILFVCEGNICRSPIAELLWEQGPEDTPCSSAGLRACVGAPIDPRSARVLHRRNYKLREFAARQFVPQMARSNLVLTMSRRQRHALAQLAPSAFPSTFTLKELAQLARKFPGQQLHTLHRQRRAAINTESLDIADPVNSTESFFETVTDEIISALNEIREIPGIQTLGR